MHQQPTPHAPPRSPLVIGLAGGIGSGKSAVAAAFGRLGCAVIDSDREAKAALDRPEVRDSLTKWWGPGVLDTAGRVDRKQLSKMVFDSPENRARLEALIHPLIRRSRVQAQEEARKAGAPAIIYDAPLLFEVGIDKSCDAVVFVDCPRKERLARVAATRGWDDAELARREAAQWPEDQKRQRSTFVIQNQAPIDGSTAAGQGELDVQAARVLAILLGVASDARSDRREHPEV